MVFKCEGFNYAQQGRQAFLMQFCLQMLPKAKNMHRIKRFHIQRALLQDLHIHRSCPRSAQPVSPHHLGSLDFILLPWLNIANRKLVKQIERKVNANVD